jgi:hypothetical protein
MIDSASETLITLIQAADELPRRRRGPKTHISTLFRWSTAGCRGVVLETIQVGRTRCTSREALQRFFERLSQVAQIEAARRAQSQRKSIGGRRTVAQRQAANAGCMLSRLVPSTNSPIRSHRATWVRMLDSRNVSAIATWLGALAAILRLAMLATERLWRP